MGSQIAILGTVEDLAELLAVARERGARAVPERIVADETPELQDPETLFRAHPYEILYLLPDDLTAVEISTVERPNQPPHARVTGRISPVVEVVPTRMVDQAMRGGRLYLGLSPSDIRFRSAKRLYDALKRAAEKWPAAKPGNVHVGPRAAALAEGKPGILKSRIGEPVTLPKVKKR
jgi:hypothetical protein